MLYIHTCINVHYDGHVRKPCTIQTILYKTITVFIFICCAFTIEVRKEERREEKKMYKEQESE